MQDFSQAKLGLLFLKKPNAIMRKNSSILRGLVSIFLLCCLSVFAQSQTVSGTVVDADKKTPLSDVTIRVVGTTVVTKTNEKGAFSIKASTGQSIQVSFIGYEQKTLPINGTSLSIQLKSSTTELDEVVVAMDIKKKPKELGYSVQSVKGSEIQETQRENFLNSLQGRIAGATITATSGVPGASATIVLRGFNSMSLSNQPLFVVDGIIIDNSTVDATSNIAASAGQSNTANDFTNRIADLNPNDIENITVLKGPEATVLYGSSASNGAIVITTRKAKLSKNQTFNVYYDNSFRFQQLQRLPSVFNEYQNGLNGIASTGTFYAYGPKYAPGTVLYDNIGTFFRSASGQTHNIGIDFGTGKSTYRITGSYYDQTGVVPNTRQTKGNFKITNTIKISNNFDITPSAQFITNHNDKSLKGAGGYLVNLMLWPATDNAQNYLLANGHKRYLYIANNDAPDASLSTSTAETDNPFFVANRNVSKDDQTRFIGTLAINATPYKWLTLAGRFGYDYYSLVGFQYKDPESAAQSSISNKGSLDNYWARYAGYNHTITATMRRTFGDFNARLTLGTRFNQTTRWLYGISGTQDSIRSFDSSATAIGTRTRLSRATLYNSSEWNFYNTVQVAEFAEMTLNYKSLIYLTASIAFESSSVLPKANRNYSYPGGSLSVIMSDLMPSLKSNMLSYWKLRASMASTARLPDPYANQSNYVPTVTSYNMPPNPIYGNLNPVPLQYAFTNANPNLRPEKQRTFEFGTEMRLFKDIVSIDADYYNTKATDQIAQGFRASYGTGFVLNTANNSSVRNEGIEISLGLKLVQKRKFDWNVQFNFNHMWSKVLAIPEPIDIAGADYYDASTWLFNNARGGIMKGYSTGTITSYGYRRQDLTPAGPNGLAKNDGQILISPTTGLPVNDGTFRIHGDRSPWITLGTINKFRYKNWSLNFLWDLRVGGDVFNATNMFMTVYGKSTKTKDRLTPRAVQGVLQDGLQNTATPTVNTIMVTPYYNYTYYGSSAMPEEDYIEHKVNYFRLRDISLSYVVTSAYLQRHMPAIKSLGLFITCNDLVMFTNYSGADPAANGGNASLKGVGAVGFDYGNIAAPLSFNAGFKLGL